MGKIKKKNDSIDVEDQSTNNATKCHDKYKNSKESEFINFNLPAFRTDKYGNTYSCLYCDTMFYDDKSVKIHLGVVHKDFHFFCKYCGEQFLNDWQLKRHMEKFAYNCEHCDYCSNHYAQYRKHSLRLHKIKLKPRFRSALKCDKYEKAYECDVCGYQVLRPHMYHKHMKDVHGTIVK